MNHTSKSNDVLIWATEIDLGKFVRDFWRLRRRSLGNVRGGGGILEGGGCNSSLFGVTAEASISTALLHYLLYESTDKWRLINARC